MELFSVIRSCHGIDQEFSWSYPLPSEVDLELTKSYPGVALCHQELSRSWQGETHPPIHKVTHPNIHPLICPPIHPSIHSPLNLSLKCMLLIYRQWSGPHSLYSPHFTPCPERWPCYCSTATCPIFRRGEVKTPFLKWARLRQPLVWWSWNLQYLFNNILCF